MTNLPMYVVEFGSVGPEPAWSELYRESRRDRAIERMTTLATSAVSAQYAPTGTRRLRVREVSS